MFKFTQNVAENLVSISYTAHKQLFGSTPVYEQWIINFKT